MVKIKMNYSVSVEEEFERFIISKKAEGIAEKTATTYNQHFHAISKYLDIDMCIYDLRKSDIENMITKMRDSSLSQNSIKSYITTLRVFLSWYNKEGIIDFNIPAYKGIEVIYYDFVKRMDISAKNLPLVEKIKKCQLATKQTYGYRRVHIWLEKQGIHCNPKTILRVMQKYNLLSVARRKRYQKYG